MVKVNLFFVLGVLLIVVSSGFRSVCERNLCDNLGVLSVIEFCELLGR